MLNIKAVAPSIMYISIELHVKCPLTKSEIKSNKLFLNVKFSHHIHSKSKYHPTKFLSQGEVIILLNVLSLQRCMGHQLTVGVLHESTNLRLHVSNIYYPIFPWIQDGKM